MNSNLVKIVGSLNSLTGLAEDMAGGASTLDQDLNHLLYELEILTKATRELVARDERLKNEFNQ